MFGVNRKKDGGRETHVIQGSRDAKGEPYLRVVHYGGRIKQSGAAGGEKGCERKGRRLGFLDQHDGRSINLRQLMLL